MGKLTKAQRRYLTTLAERGPQMPPSGPGCWPLQNSLWRAKLVDTAGQFLWGITDAGRAALSKKEA